MYISEDIQYLGVNDLEIDLFESQFVVPKGMTYNSYLIKDEKLAVMDTVDVHFGDTWLNNLEQALNGQKPDYLIVHHMEPDHSANIAVFMEKYPETTIVASMKAFQMMKNFFNEDYSERRIIVKEGDKLSLGKHELNFIGAPMVHWPEVILSYDSFDKALFSADAFGKFGIVDEEENWDQEARRYYFGIVGKYGPSVQALLKKCTKFDIQKICPLHGPVLNENLEHYLNLYDTWSAYRPEKKGTVIAYTSIYGHTKTAALKLAETLKTAGEEVVVYDLCRCDIYQAVSDAFAYDKLVLASTTYNCDVFPKMHSFIHHLVSRDYQNRFVAFIENGSWACMACRCMKNMFEKSRNLCFAENNVSINSALNENSTKQLEALANEILNK